MRQERETGNSHDARLTPERPAPHYIGGLQVYRCPACRDCGYRMIEVVILDNERMIHRAAATPCRCDYGRAVATALDAGDEIRKSRGLPPWYSVPVQFSKDLLFGPYDLGPVTPGDDPRVWDGVPFTPPPTRAADRIRRLKGLAQDATEAKP